MKLVKRAIKAALFITLHALIAIAIMSILAPSWIIGCSIMAATAATLMLILFAGEEEGAQLFFGENWDKLEETGTTSAGFLMALVGCIWLVPIGCFFFSIGLLIIARLMNI